MFARYTRPTGLISLTSLLIASAALTVACDETVGPAPLGSTEQAIYYGTTSPSVVPMSTAQQTGIGFLADPWGNPFCSGTLIDRDVVVTASHCTEGSDASTIVFGMGSPLEPKALIEVARIAEHPSMDAALLILAEDALARVPEASTVDFIRQPLPQSMVGGQVEAAGFGETDDGSAGRHFAMLVLAGIEDDFYRVDGQGQRGICFGDSGGPLLVNLNGSVAVAGVESHGDSSCVDVDYLTRLDRIADWIDREAGGISGGGGSPDKPEPAPGGGGTVNPDKPEPGSGGGNTGGGNTGGGGGSEPGPDYPLMLCSASGSPITSAWWMLLPLAWVVVSTRRR